MYSKEGKVQDRREMLRVKAKSLAEEARIIRREEKRLGSNNDGQLRQELQWHRRWDVRREARATYLAYGLVRGKPLDRIEIPASPRDKPLVDKVIAMLKKYGPCDAVQKESLIRKIAT